VLVTSGAMDGVAPKLNQDESLREKQTARSTAAANPQHNHADELYTESAFNTDDQIRVRQARNRH